MRAELKRMGLSLDWAREFATCDPEYYGQQQKLFLDFWKAGLVERKESWVNWDPVDGTVLANEQVIDGRGWRSGALVEKKKLAQWFLASRSTRRTCWRRWATLDRWPERVKLMQANWIGRSEGARVRFALAEPVDGIDEVEVFTTRPDTLFGMSLPGGRGRASAGRRGRGARPGGGGVRRRMPPHGHREAAIEQAEKRGFDTGIRVTHPFIEGASFPVWIANFVLMEYGTGAIFGCPAHDQRDLDFAREIRPGGARPWCCRRAPMPATLRAWATTPSPMTARSSTPASSTGWTCADAKRARDRRAGERRARAPAW